MTEVFADFFHGTQYVCGDHIIKEDSIKISGDVSEIWGVDRNKLEIYAYSLSDMNQVDKLLEQGYSCDVAKGSRTVKNFKGEVISQVKGEKLEVWELQSTIQSHNSTANS